MQDAPDLFVDLDGINPEVAFAAGGAEEVVAQVEADAREAASTDLSTATARGIIAALAFKVARTKVALDDMGKNHVAHLKQQAKEVDVERKAIRDRLDALRDAVRKPLTDWETAETTRIQDHQAALAEIENATAFDTLEPAAKDIQDRIDRLSAMGGNRDWQEFEKRAAAAKAGAMAKLTVMLGVTLRREAERAELERLREQEAQHAKDAEVTKVADMAAARARLEAAAEVAAANQRAAGAVTEARKQVEAEQAQQSADAAARANDRGHRAKINAAARDALCARAGLSSDLATAVIVAIARGQIDHIAISY